MSCDIHLGRAHGVGVEYRGWRRVDRLILLLSLVMCVGVQGDFSGFGPGSLPGVVCELLGFRSSRILPSAVLLNLRKDTREATSLVNRSFTGRVPRKHTLAAVTAWATLGILGALVTRPRRCRKTKWTGTHKGSGDVACRVASCIGATARTATDKQLYP